MVSHTTLRMRVYVGAYLLQPTELIAGKCYFKGGVILHTVFFSGSLYCVLADANDDQPLLDVAFPDVTARCRGYVSP